MENSKSTGSVSKRQFLGMMAAASAVSISPNLLASNKHAGHNAAYSKDLVEVAEECVSVGQACKAHIYQTLKSDDLSLTKCLLQVRDTISTCNSLVELVTNGSKHSKAMAKVCADICKDCRDECKKHASKHEICKAMADSCDATIKACLKYIG
ncbi:MAG: four-helix bundle copper-binding protein [Pseudomonadales bacterium]|nr:four-helix bundle copper-binding protein [Pseudomonadales bacterium]